MKLDATDRRLLSVLQVKGRISNSDLADQVNMSASACHRRVGRLEVEGYIRDYVALVGSAQSGSPNNGFCGDYVERTS
jgi:Lrp/AsnC family leucine-responsive transcriptional regulator